MSKVSPEKKKEYNRKYREKHKDLLKEKKGEEKPKPKEVIEKPPQDENDYEQQEIDEEYLENLINNRVNEKLQFFLNKNKNTKQIQPIKKTETQQTKETSSFWSQIAVACGISIIPPIINKVVLSMIIPTQRLQNSMQTPLNQPQPTNQSNNLYTTLS